MNKHLILASMILILAASCKNTETAEAAKDRLSSAEGQVVLPDIITINGIAQNPEGIEFNKNDNTFFLSSLNAGPIIKIDTEGNYKPFTSGEAFPMSTAGLQIDYKNNRLLAAAFNGMELMDQDPKTRGTAHLRIYNLETGKLEKDINLSSLVPDAPAYMANDIAIDKAGNAYISDWFAGVVYVVDTAGNPGVFWKNDTGIKSGVNGIDYHPEGYLLASLVGVGETGLYQNYGLVKIPVNTPKQARLVKITSGYTGFDGMVLKSDGNVIGITNNGKTGGGNTLIELSSKDYWESAAVVNSKDIRPSTTVAVTPENSYFIIHQDFSPGAAAMKNWTIEKVSF